MKKDEIRRVLMEEAKKYKTAEEFVEAESEREKLYETVSKIGKNYNLFTHGSPEKIIHEIKRGGEYNIFDGLFACSGIHSYHSGYEHHFIIDNNKIARNGDVDLDYKKSIEYLKSEYPKMSEDDLDLLYEKTARDKHIEDESDNPLAKYGFRDVGEAGWEAQRLRGNIAINQGYDAIAMSDEHGTSYLIPAGSKAINYTKQLIDIWNKANVDIIAHANAEVF